MLRALLRIVLLLIVVAAIAAFVIGYRWADRDTAADRDGVVGTSGATTNVERAREAGAALGQSVADGANRAQRFAADAALTTKIKSKMALDDSIRAMAIDVDTAGGIVTLRGSVDSAAQRQRAVQLAEETEGVTSVIDLLSVRY